MSGASAMPSHVTRSPSGVLRLLGVLWTTISRDRGGASTQDPILRGHMSHQGIAAAYGVGSDVLENTVLVNVQEVDLHYPLFAHSVL